LKIKEKEGSNSILKVQGTLKPKNTRKEIVQPLLSSSHDIRYHLDHLFQQKIPLGVFPTGIFIFLTLGISGFHRSIIFPRSLFAFIYFATILWLSFWKITRKETSVAVAT